ncbi:cell wall-binding repeat-containing protein [Clostridium bowmanii]|uniref:cell wall-binding repeat-containing protein n=1 Tax=Clostridium bowmanii TaxID=132925 RepID=UPI0035E40A58
MKLAGTTRYETNAKVVDNFKADTSLNLNNIFISSGEEMNYIDTLAGAPLAVSIGAPIIFIHNTINSGTGSYLVQVSRKARNMGHITWNICEDGTNLYILKNPAQNFSAAYIFNENKMKGGDLHGSCINKSSQCTKTYYEDRC